MKYKPGDVVFATNKKSWLSKIFKWFMMSKWSHTFMIAESTDSRTYIVETSSFESMINLMSSYELDPDAALEVWRPSSLTQEQILKIVEGSLSKIETPYGWLQFLSLALVCIGKRVGLKIPNLIRQGLICDQLVLSGYTLSDIPGLEGIDPKSIETQEFYEILTSAKYTDGTMAFQKVGEKS